MPNNVASALTFGGCSLTQLLDKLQTYINEKNVHLKFIALLNIGNQVPAIKKEKQISAVRFLS